VPSGRCAFGIRTGTSRGVSSRAFRVECARDLATWIRGIVHGAHGAAAAVRQLAWGACPPVDVCQHGVRLG